MPKEISIKTVKDITSMREGGKKLAQVMSELEKMVAPGVSTLELDALAEKLIKEAGGIPSFKGYGAASGKPFPGTICSSINNEIVHGIPRKDVKIKEGDIIKIDVGMKYEGFHTDMARTLPVGKVSIDKQKIIDTVRESFYQGISAMKPGKKLNKYSKAVQKYVEKEGYSVIRGLVGHGIGKKLHEYPQIPNYFDRNSCNFRLEPGMTFALEPMINVGTHEIKLSSDGWTFETEDGELSAHWENTILITSDGVEVLTEN